MFTGRGLNTADPSVLNECPVRALAQRWLCVCAVLALHHHNFFIVELLCTNYKQLCNLCEASFSKSSSCSLCRSSCACLASSLKLDARQLTCSREG